jgi:hypothetical protein
MKRTVTYAQRPLCARPAPAAVAAAALLIALSALAAPAAAPRSARPRTLESITIEGEIAVPQVLFITARDARRFRDGTGASYQKGPAEVARSVSGPARLRMTTGRDVLKEEAP